MDALRIIGGLRLHGAIAASGSKNATLPIMAAAILCDGPVVLSGAPHLTDVHTLGELLRHLGVDAHRNSAGGLQLHTTEQSITTAPTNLVRRMRASFCVLGPLLARRGRAVVPLPGGCNIGHRPVDLHLAGLAALGARIRIERGFVIAEAAKLCGAKLDLRGPHGSTVTGTANVMSAAVLAQGTTIITGAATEPEVVDLGRFLIAAGANIQGLGTHTLEIRGVERLTAAQHEVIPDRVEAATLLLAAVITRGTISVTNVRPEHLSSVLEAVSAAGADVAVGNHKITVHAEHRPRAVDLIARPYPGIPTDLQAQFMALLALADGTSVIADDVFPERTLHLAELARLGARIERQDRLTVVDGVHRLSGAEVTATDLRATAALLLAGLAARGETIIHEAEHLERGYERLPEKLNQLGAQISRMPAKPISVPPRSARKTRESRIHVTT
jgi:UDP-N-acetylglucosamine 1-carboxyvinyltransferase